MNDLKKYEELKEILNVALDEILTEKDLYEEVEDYVVKIDINGKDRSFKLNADLVDELEKFIDNMIELEKELNKYETTTYEHTYSEDLDMTIVVKTTETNEKIVTEISGFYFGRPSEDEIELFKDRGNVSVVEK